MACLVWFVTVLRLLQLHLKRNRLYWRTNKKPFYSSSKISQVPFKTLIMRKLWLCFTFLVLLNEEELSLNVLKPTLSLLIPIWKPFIAVMAAWALLGLSKLTNPKHLLWFVARSMNTWGRNNLWFNRKFSDDIFTDLRTDNISEW